MRINKMCALIGDISECQELAPLTNRRPVSLLPFDGIYRMIDFSLSNIVDAGINSTYMIFNQGMTQSVFDHIRGGKEWHLNSLPNRFFIHFFQDLDKEMSEEEHYYDGVIEYLEKANTEFTVFIGNKMLCNVDLAEVRDIHKQHPDDITIVYKKMPKEEIDKKDIILDVAENGCIENTTIYGETAQDNDFEDLFMNIFIVKTEWLIEELKRDKEENVPVSVQNFLNDSIKKMTTWTYEYTGFLSNIFNIKSYYDANMMMLESNQFLGLLHSSKKIYMKSINAVPTYYADSSYVKNSQIAAGCMIYGEVDNSILSAGVTVESGAEVSKSIVMTKSIIKEDVVIKHAILDKNVIVEKGLRIIGTADKPIVIRKRAHITTDMIQMEGEIDESLILHS